MQNGCSKGRHARQHHNAFRKAAQLFRAQIIGEGHDTPTACGGFLKIRRGFFE